MAGGHTHEKGRQTWYDHKNEKAATAAAATELKMCATMQLWIDYWDYLWTHTMTYISVMATDLNSQSVSLCSFVDENYFCVFISNPFESKENKIKWTNEPTAFVCVCEGERESEMAKTRRYYWMLLCYLIVKGKCFSLLEIQNNETKNDRQNERTKKYESVVERKKNETNSNCVE